MQDSNAHEDKVPAAAQPLGHVHAVSGSQISVGLLNAVGLHRAGATVGKFVKIHTGKALLIGVITELSVSVPSGIREQGYCGSARVDLTGEIGERSGAVRVQRGVADYPTIGDSVSALHGNELRVVFATVRTPTIKLGHLQQDNTIPVSVDVDAMLGMHFA